MPPSMSAREREVLVVGRSYAPALLGWCSAMRSSLTWYPRSSSATLGTPDCCACTQSVSLLCSKAIFMPTVAAFPQKEEGVYQSAWEAPGHDRLRRHISE
jgi:hypothetical protein